MTTPPYDSSATEPIRQAPPAAPLGAPAAPPVAPAGPPAPVPEPVRPRPVTGRPGGSRMLNLALGAAVLVAAAGVAFAAGRATAPAGTTAGTTGVIGGAGNGGTGDGFPGNGSFPGNGPFPSGGRGGTGGLGDFGGGLTIQGTVDAVTADSVTIKLASGQTITVGLSSDTTYHQQAAASANDVQSGSSVILRLTGGFIRGNGDTSGSGSLGTASDVTIVP